MHERFRVRGVVILPAILMVQMPPQVSSMTVQSLRAQLPAYSGEPKPRKYCTDLESLLETLNTCQLHYIRSPSEPFLGQVGRRALGFKALGFGVLRASGFRYFGVRPRGPWAPGLRDGVLHFAPVLSRRQDLLDALRKGLHACSLRVCSPFGYAKCRSGTKPEVWKVWHR